MALDIYVWLAQRLHRVPSHRPQFIGWASLKEQFGPGYGRMDNFKRDFRTVLATVLTQYRDAKINVNGYGVTLHNSSPPIAKTSLVKTA